MEGSSWTFTLSLLLLLLWVSMSTQALLTLHMKDFISAVKQVEGEDPGSEPLVVLKKLRRAASLNDTFTQHFLPNVDSAGAELNSSLSDYIHKAVHHRVTEDFTEEGVVLTPDGTSVALGELLMGMEAGFLSNTGTPKELLHLTLGRNLALTLEQNISASNRFGPDGCWDSITTPQVFTLSDPPSMLTTAQVNGGMDGTLLGMEVSNKSRKNVKLSSLLTEYYCHQLKGKGMDEAPLLISQRRKDNFRRLVLPSRLSRTTVESEELQRRLAGGSTMDEMEKGQMMGRIEEGMNEFIHMYMDCPPIIPRCQWGAKPYKGTPTNLSLPLNFLYIHHTYIPGQPCLTFEQCSANMRSMQRFHQEERGWDDIGYSFVAGSDGFLYEGRGWLWRGAHTLGQNSRGYGVSFIGDYTSQLPSQHAMGLVRHQLTSCAVGGGRLVGNFTLQGHRQVVATACPGNALYSEITGWEHFGV
ncbi:peptidoglycan recognition protein 6 [Gouania willdenowi]|uniref:peptidoglycan recognition protein 6 n=1 Tax=Gouania willdenowi TaxID=441366 RepID=UPI0010551A50|nr:N-acetylmuramoyl-L-alanine amidase-like [Gouania willdenowi]